TGMWSTTTLVSFCLPHSVANSPSNHWSNSGKKWAHLAIRSVFLFWACARPEMKKYEPGAAFADVIRMKFLRSSFFALPLAIRVLSVRASSANPLRNRICCHRGVTLAHAVHGEVPRRLQARKVGGKPGVQFLSCRRKANHVQKRIGSYRPVPG